MRDLSKRLQILEAGAAPLGIPGTKSRSRNLLDQTGLSVGRRPKTPQVARSDTETRQPATRVGDVSVQFDIALLSRHGPRHQQTEVLQLSRQPGVDSRALAEPGEIEMSGNSAFSIPQTVPIVSSRDCPVCGDAVTDMSWPAACN